MGRFTRAWIGARVALATLLAFAAAVLATEVADWRYLRFDLSESGRNTLAATTLERVDNLEGTLRIETFLKQLQLPYDQVSGEALSRTVDLLALLESTRRDEVEVVHHDMSDPAAVLREQMRLGVEGENVLVVEYEGRRTPVRVFGEVAAVDWGNPTPLGLKYLSERGIPNVYDPRTWNPSEGAFVGAKLTGFYGEAALSSAIARVSAGDAPLVCFSTGHGEQAIDGTLSSSYSRLRGELERDGFRVTTWNGADAALPSDCAVLAVLGPRQPLGDAEREAVRDHVARGGRLVLAPGNEAPHAIVPLAEPYGLALEEGIVCEEIRDARGQLIEGDPYCAVLKVDGRTMAADHPVTELMRRNGLRLEFSNAFSFARGPVPALAPADGGSVARVRELVRTTRDAWRDLPDARVGGVNFAFDQTVGERKGAAGLVLLAELSDRVGPPTAGPGGASTEGGRVIALGAATFAADGLFVYNRDFLRALFNWLAERDQRIDVAPCVDDTTRLDVERGRAYGVLAWTLSLVIPGACALMGVFVSWRRRR